MKRIFVNSMTLFLIATLAVIPLSSSDFTHSVFAQSQSEQAREAAQESEESAREAAKEFREAAEEAEKATRETAEETEKEFREEAEEAEKAAREAAQEATRETAEEDEDKAIITSTTIKNLKIKADIGEGVAEVEVELEYVTPKTDLDEVSQELVDLFSLDRQTVDDELELTFFDDELGTESGIITDEEINVHADGDKNSSEVEAELKFTIESTDPEIIKDTIVEKTQLDLALIGDIVAIQAPLQEFASEAEIEAREKALATSEKMRNQGLAIAEKMRERGLAVSEKMQERGFAIAEKMRERGINMAERFGAQGGMGQQMSGQGLGMASEMSQMDIDTAQSTALTGINIGTTASERETISEVKSEVIIEELEQKIQRLENRIQSLLEKVEQGRYYLPENVAEDSQKNSLNVSFEGQTEDESVAGSVFLENIATRQNAAKFKVTGGEILVGESVAYDVVFGKARIVKGPAQDVLMIVGQIIDSEENVSTIRLALQADQLKDDVAQGFADFDLGPSKIANKRIASGLGQVTAV